MLFEVFPFFPLWVVASNYWMKDPVCTWNWNMLTCGCWSHATLLFCWTEQTKKMVLNPNTLQVLDKTREKLVPCFVVHFSIWNVQLSALFNKKNSFKSYIFCVNWKQMNVQTKFLHPLQLLSHFLFQASVWIWWELLLWTIIAEQWVKDTNEVQIFKMLFQKSCTVNALKA